MKPYEPLPECVEYKGETYRLNLSYSAFFTVSDVLEDERLLYGHRLTIALSIFIIDESFPVEAELLKAIYDLVKDDRPKNTGPKYMDIEQDWPYICAGFQQAYGIDLYADKSMHILKWQALLQGLPKNTKLMDIIGIRAAQIPEITKYNSEQVAELTRLKALYALKSDKNDLQAGLGNLFDILAARAQMQGA